MFRGLKWVENHCYDILGHIDEHESGVDRHHHLVLHLRQVLGQGVHGGADLPGHGDGVFGVAHAVLGNEKHSL